MSLLYLGAQTWTQSSRRSLTRTELRGKTTSLNLLAVLFLMQSRILPFVELHEVFFCPSLQPVKVPLNGSTALWCISHSSQLRIIGKLAEGALCPLIQATDE